MTTTVDDCLKVAQAASLASHAYAAAGQPGMARIYADHCAAAFHMARITAVVPAYDHSTPLTTPENPA